MSDKNKAAEVADLVVPEYRKMGRSYSCTGVVAKRWSAAYEAAAHDEEQEKEMTTDKKTIPLDQPLHIRPVMNGGWVIQIGEDQRLNQTMFAFSSFSEVLRALVATSNAAGKADAPDEIEFDERTSTDKPRGRLLRDLHLEVGDMVCAVSDNFPIGIKKGDTFRVKLSAKTCIVTSGSVYLDMNYRGARFEVIHRQPKMEAL